MGTTQKDIRNWLKRGENEDNSHMIVVCDTFDHSDYPVYVKAGVAVQDKVSSYQNGNMTKVMEVYNYGLDLEDQLTEQRAWHI